MLRIQLSFAVLLAGAASLILPWWIGGVLASAGVEAANVTTARASQVAEGYFQANAHELVAEAMAEAGRAKPSKYEKDPPDHYLRWRLDGAGLLTTVAGGAKVPVGANLSGLDVVSSALDGEASDGIANLRTQPKNTLWHLAAAPVSGGLRQVAGVVVVGVRISAITTEVNQRVKSLTQSGDPALRVGVVINDSVYGDLPPMVSRKTRRGFLVGEPVGIGTVDVGPFMRLDESAWVVSARSLQSQAGAGLIVAASDVAYGLGQTAERLQTGAIVGLALTFLGLIVAILLGRRLSASAGELASWLSDWRIGESSPIPLASLRLHPLFARLSGALDLALESKRGSRQPTSILDSLVPEGNADFDAADLAFEGLSDLGEASDDIEEDDDIFADAARELEDSEPEEADAVASAPVGGPTLPPIPMAPEGAAEAPPEIPDGQSEEVISKFKVAQDSQIAPGDPAEFGDMATGQFSVPESLLAQISSDEVEEDARPHEELYGEYIAMRERLGEDVDSITYERFVKKIDRTRGKILEDTGARDVRFSVKEKAGRASLRAMPVMDP